MAQHGRITAYRKNVFTLPVILDGPRALYEPLKHTDAHTHTS